MITFYILTVQIMGGSKFSQISCFIAVNTTTLAEILGERNTHNHRHINHHQNNHREKKGDQLVFMQPLQQLCDNLCDDDDELATEDSQTAN